MAKIATIETRYENCGFAYTDKTRMLFAPRSMVTRKDEDKALSDIVLQATTWGDPTSTDVASCVAALSKKYPAVKLLIETANGLVSVYEP